MKKILTLVLLTFTTSVMYSQSRWNIGLQTGMVTNITRFESGQEEANALFTNNPHPSILFGVDFRYKISSKFSLQSGLHFTEFGFNYGMAKNYSLLHPEKHNNEISASTCITSLPVMMILNTPVNCRNVRFIFGLGLAVRGIDNEWNTINEAEISASEAANARTTYMTAESHTLNGFSPAGTWMIGLEKLYSKGNSLSFTFQGTQGFSTIAESTVRYTASSQEYTHTFINRGSYATIAIAYNFSPMGTHKANKALKNAAK